MRKFHFWLSLVVVALLPMAVQASWEGPYVQVLGGLSYPVSIKEQGQSLTYKRPGYALGGALGYRSGLFSYTGEVTYNNTRYNHLTARPEIGGRTQATTLAAAIYLNIPTHFFIEPYIGGGFGYIYLENDANIQGLVKKISDFTFLFQATGGLAMPIAEHWLFSADYRFYVSNGLGTYGGARYENHLLNFGVAYRF